MSTMLEPSPELVNPVPIEEVAEWSRGMTVAFLGDPESDSGRRTEILRRVWEPERAWGVRDHGRWVATLRTEERTLSVPGHGALTRDLRADALTNVTVSATHRRRGLMRQMLEGSLAAARERGDAVSILIAAEWPIYGRFGYAPATLAANYTLRSSRSGASCPGEPSRVRAVQREELGKLAPRIFAAARRERAGQIDRSADWYNRILGLDGYEPYEGLPSNWFVHDADDGPDGLLAWKATGSVSLIPPFGTLEVWDMATATDEAYRDFWSYLSGIDLVDEVKLSNRPVDEEVRWLLTDGRALVMTEQVDFTWLRLLDVAAALAARRYAVPGEVTVEVIDEDTGGPAAGRYRLNADGDEAECQRTNRAADVQITQRALASIYLGGFTLRQLITSQAVSELTPGTLAHIDAMFATPLAPWNATWF